MFIYLKFINYIILYYLILINIDIVTNFVNFTEIITVLNYFMTRVDLLLGIDNQKLLIYSSTVEKLVRDRNKYW